MLLLQFGNIEAAVAAVDVSDTTAEDAVVVGLGCVTELGEQSSSMAPGGNEGSAARNSYRSSNEAKPSLQQSSIIERSLYM